ncbi:CoA-binding protein [Salidesulfovibrio brasiliensis]|uniref:CoA-binding protein n=1 Tax=Salidesulfovibrio brasiliensis TaxID=221711 RepID=UPI0006D2AC7D|nr:CoA-binding protein [Salidesulfovibrio brasiliensis]
MLYSDKELIALLSEVKTIAIIGAVDKPGRPVDMVGRALIDNGFTIIPVHPVRQDVWGLRTYKSVTDIPHPVDMVNLFRASQFCPAHANEVLKMTNRPKAFWMQSGIASPEARAMLEPEGIFVVENSCLKVEVARLGVSPR